MECRGSSKILAWSSSQNTTAYVEKGLNLLKLPTAEFKSEPLMMVA